MRLSSLLPTALMLTVVSVASADDFGRYRPTRYTGGGVSNPFQSPAAKYYASPTRAGSFTDYPAYPIGFTSYRGLGFWGTCCEKNPPGTEQVWDGYCAQKGSDSFQKGKHCGMGPCGCCKSHHGKLLQMFASKPDWCCYPECCSSRCGGVGANWWPVTPKCRQKCHEPLSCKLRRLHDRCFGMLNGSCTDDGCTDCQMQAMPMQQAPTKHGPSPTPAEPQPVAPQPVDSVMPTPADAQPQLPAPETSLNFSDELPPLSPLDKSARRWDLRRLPAISITY